MSDLGKTVSDIKSQGKWKSLTTSTPKNPIGIKTPLEKGKSQGETIFRMHYDITDQIQDNLKNLIMTQKGERLGFPDYGTSLRTIYSNVELSEEQIVDYASNEIKNVVTKYMPNINLMQFYSEIADFTEAKKDSANLLGLKYLENQSKITTTKSHMVDINKDNPNLKSLYKIKIDYSIPILEQNKTRSIILYINNSK